MTKVGLLDRSAPLREISRVLSVLSQDAPRASCPSTAARRVPEFLTAARKTLLLSVAAKTTTGGGDKVTLTWGDKGTALLELNDPHTLNAMSDELLQALAGKLSSVMASRTARALVL